MLDERKERAITLIIEGARYTDIAKLVGCARQSLYEWLKNEEFVAELDRRRQEIIVSGNNMILNKLSKYIDGVDTIASASESDKSKLDALFYLIDRVLGKSTSKVSIDDNRDDKDQVDVDVLEQELKTIDNE